jgi:hypothetical protein
MDVSGDKRVLDHYRHNASISFSFFFSAYDVNASSDAAYPPTAPGRPGMDALVIGSFLVEK